MDLQHQRRLQASVRRQRHFPEHVQTEPVSFDKLPPDGLPDEIPTTFIPAIHEFIPAIHELLSSNPRTTYPDHITARDGNFSPIEVIDAQTQEVRSAFQAVQPPATVETDKLKDYHFTDLTVPSGHFCLNGTSLVKSLHAYLASMRKKGSCTAVRHTFPDEPCIFHLEMLSTTAHGHPAAEVARLVIWLQQRLIQQDIVVEDEDAVAVVEVAVGQMRPGYPLGASSLSRTGKAWLQ
eukprot:NODE_167_length_1941_cov_110.674947_g125_i0.p3 GENE.NODE_167_length_1941_cov_110.674947_g125_i0~~NODE_167_length_1941_cov_110.674947_g125_i0.p3  ORF type:complete len:236 (+),score=3.32 NODE_167_length_1941_cov_110.674947_g125_i0:58-765(+)